jgi:hypothetical protein
MSRRQTDFGKIFCEVSVLVVNLHFTGYVDERVCVEGNIC